MNGSVDCGSVENQGGARHHQVVDCEMDCGTDEKRPGAFGYVRNFKPQAGLAWWAIEDLNL